jgi:hypothetical protein
MQSTFVTKWRRFAAIRKNKLITVESSCCKLATTSIRGSAALLATNVSCSDSSIDQISNRCSLLASSIARFPRL